MILYNISFDDFRLKGVRCDACDVTSFQLRRYKCLQCDDYDLCGLCHDNQRETNRHKKDHPMQCLILEGDRNIFFQNDVTSVNYPLSITMSIYFEHLIKKYLNYTLSNSKMATLHR